MGRLTVHRPIVKVVSSDDGIGERRRSDTLAVEEPLEIRVAGDTLADFGNGLEVSIRWLREGVTPESRVERLRPLLDKPVEHVLATHGGPFDRAALEQALTQPSE